MSREILDTQVPRVVFAAMSRRSLTLLIASVGTAVAIAVSVLVPVPYVILGPGPTLNTLGKDSSGHPLITISGHPAYPTSGHLNMVTVSYQGCRATIQHLHRPGGLAEPAPGGRPGERDLPRRADREADPGAGHAADDQLAADATAAALTELHIPYSTVVVVMQPEPGFPA